MLPNVLNRHSNGNRSNELEVPQVPFASANSIRSNTPLNAPPLSTSPSLSANYLPTKFSDSLLYNGFRRRNIGKTAPPGIPKRGGGRAVGVHVSLDDGESANTMNSIVHGHLFKA